MDLKVKVTYVLLILKSWVVLFSNKRKLKGLITGSREGRIFTHFFFIRPQIFLCRGKEEKICFAYDCKT
jgi:hypothetical protein